MDSTTVLRWACTCTINTAGIPFAPFPEEDAIEQYFMMPVVAKVVGIICSVTDRIKEVGNRGFPACVNFGIALDCIVIRNANFYGEWVKR